MTDDDTDRSGEWRSRYMPLDEQNPEGLREFIRRAEAGEFDDSHEINQTVRVARLLLDGEDGSRSSG